MPETAAPPHRTAAVAARGPAPNASAAPNAAARVEAQRSTDTGPPAATGVGGIAEAVGADIETTLYGDLPADFWGDPDPSSDVTAGDSPDPIVPGVGSDDAIPLFVPSDGGAALPLPRGGSVARSEPLEPEGERFDQLRALFPGRIIEVLRPPPETGTGSNDGHDEAGTVPYDSAAGYAEASSNEANDEPRYDTAAEAAAEE